MRLFFLFFLLSNILPAQLWVKLPDFPATKRDDGVAVVVNNVAYFGTGLQEWNATIDFYALELTTRTWTAIPTMPNTTERQYACAFPGTNCFYVSGGEANGVALTSLFKYDITKATWTELAPKPGKGILAAVCFSFGDKVIIACGRYADGKNSPEVWEYNLTANTWTQKANFPFSPVRRASGTGMDGFGYMLFGIDTNNVFRKELYRYNPTADSWQALINFPLPKGRAYAAIQGFKGRLFVFGGQDDQGLYYNDSWNFNTTSILWYQGQDLPSTGRRGGMSCGSGQDFYYSCGYGPNGRLTETWSTDLPVALTENKRDPGISVYPNPCREKITLRIPTRLSQISVQLLDVLGNSTNAELQKNGDGSYDLATADLPVGLYLIRVFEGNNLMGSTRLAKQ